MISCPLGLLTPPLAGPALYDTNEVRGGSAYGAGTLAGATGSRQPSKLELDYAQHQVRFFC